MTKKNTNCVFERKKQINNYKTGKKGWSWPNCLRFYDYAEILFWQARGGSNPKREETSGFFFTR